MVSWRPVAAVLTTVLGGVFLLIGLGPMIACFGAGRTGTSCTVGSPATLGALAIGSALFALGNYLVYREYGVVLAGYGGGGGGGPGGPGRYR